MLKKFKVDPTRHELVVGLEFYQMGMARAVEQARKLDPELFVDGDDRLASWSKFAKDPIRAKGLWTRMLEAVFLGQNNLPELDVDRQTNTSGQQVAMMFLPGSIRRSSKVDNLVKVIDITKQVLKGWHVIGVYGMETSNRKSEAMVKDEVEKATRRNENVLIISAGMAQRSFSIGEIDALYLCYDVGDAGATTQKISRALTPSLIGKVGRIFSLSFDPNRDDKFDTMMLATAQNYAKRKGIEENEALRTVIDTIDIFACSPNGRVHIDIDTYLMQLLERKSIARVTGKQADLSLLDYEELIAAATGNTDYDRAAKTEIAPTGKTGTTTKKKGPKNAALDREQVKLEDKVRKVLTTIVEHLPYIAFMTGKDTVMGSLKRSDEVDDYREYVTAEFGVSPSTIIDWFNRGVLPLGLASLQQAAKSLQIQQS